MTYNLKDLQNLFPESYVKRNTSSGVELVIRNCPLDPSHKPWKFYLNPQKGVAHCFICHSEGGGVSVGKLLKNKTIRVRKTDTVKETKSELPNLPKSKSLYSLPIDHPALVYIGNRGIDFDAAVFSGVTFKSRGTPAWYKINKHGRKYGVGPEAGLIIPVYTRGKLQAWQFAPIVRRPNRPKYLTAPGSNLSHSLFNFDNVSQESDTLVIMEGATDALKLPKYSVALFCDNINKHRTRLISTGGFREIIVCLDGDRSKKHVETQLNRIRSCASSTRAVYLESGKDPGDYTKQELLEALDI